MRIPNGYKLNMPLHQVWKLMEIFRKKVHVKSLELKGKLVAEIAVNVFDDFYLSPDHLTFLRVAQRRYEMRDLKDNALQVAFRTIWKNEEKFLVTQHKKPDYDFECKVVLFPGNRYTLAVLITEQDEFIKIWHDMKGVQPYPYVLGGKTDDVSEREWNQRKRDWTKAMKDNTRFTDAGFTVECNTSSDWSSLNVLSFLPPFGKRVNRHAKDRVLREKILELLGQEEIEIYNMVSYFRKANDWLKTLEGEKRFRQEIERVANILKQDITLEDLIRDFDTYEENTIRFPRGIEIAGLINQRILAGVR
jgi:hypothetical protein